MTWTALPFSVKSLHLSNTGLARTSCCFSKLTLCVGWWWSKTRWWVGVVIFYVRPPFLLSFANHVMKVSSTVCLTFPFVSHFPALRHHSVPFTNLFLFSFYFCPELVQTVGPFWEASVAAFSAPAVPLPPLLLSHAHAPFFCLIWRWGIQQGDPPSTNLWLYGFLNLYECKEGNMCQQCDYMFSLSQRKMFPELRWSGWQ